MTKRYILSGLFILFAISSIAQETAQPVLQKSNRIILHFKDTTGLFLQLGKIFVDRGYDFEMISPELGLLKTRPSKLPGSSIYKNELRAVFRDSTISFSSVAYFHDCSHEVVFPATRYNIIDLAWSEMMKIGALLEPASITYAAIK
jgi:hypothetical protein